MSKPEIEELGKPRKGPSVAEQRAALMARNEKVFGYHPPQGDQAARYTTITQASKMLADILVQNCPPSAELTLALRAVEEARMRANQSIAVNE